MAQAKRVVLRLQEADVNDCDLYEPVRLYLEKNGRSSSEIEANRHIIHIQPPNPHIPQVNPSIYIVVDIEKEQFSGPLDKSFPHEFYRIPRHGNELYVRPLGMSVILLICHVGRFIVTVKLHGLRISSGKFANTRISFILGECQN